MDRLKKRSEFLSVARGARAARRAFVLQGRCDGDAERGPRFGFTVTKKIGNAVVRNRIRRRLKAAVDIAAADARDGCDYVLIGRWAALSSSFPRLTRDLEGALSAIHKELAAPDGAG